MRDIRLAWRGLLRSPGFTAVVVLTLALSLGAVTAAFSVVHGVLLQPLPFAEPERLARVINHPEGNRSIRYEAAYPAFLTWREATTEFDDLAGFASSSGGVLVRFGDSLEQVGGSYVSWNLFSVLGTAPVLGRPFDQTDDVVGAAPVVAVSERLWRERFGASPDLVGSTLEVDGESRTVVAVLPRAFEYPVGAEVWIPLASALPPALLESPQIKFFNPVGRLREGSSPERAASELNRLMATLTNPQLAPSQRSEATLEPLAEELVGDVEGPLAFLLGAASLVLVLAAANVSNLAAVRALGRRRERVVRSALGAGWWDLLRLSFAEGALLAGAGGIAGLGLAVWGVAWLLELSPASFFRAGQVGLSGEVAAFAAALAALAALVLGLVPGWLGRRRSLALSLREGAASTTEGRSGRRLLGGFVVLQVTLALVLLLGAGLLGRSFAALYGVETGFDRERVLTFSVPLLTEDLQDPAAAGRFHAELLERAEALPGVERAAGVLLRPLQSLNGYDAGLTIEGRPEEEQARYPLVNYEAVTPGYFQVMGLPLVEGRDLARGDRDDAPPVAVVSRAVAERFWPGESPVGRRLKWGGPDSEGPWVEVVGVVGNARSRRLEEVSLDVYVPHLQSTWPLNHLVVRTSGEPLAVVGSLHSLIGEIEPALQPMDVATTAQLVARSAARPRFQALLLGLFAGLALALGALGLYGVLAHTLALRTAEVGIRMALGARPAQVLRLALGSGLRLAGAGVLLGLAVGLGLSQLLGKLLAGLLFGVEALDPVAFLAVPALLLAVALAASLVPALRASRVSPTVALRAD